MSNKPYDVARVRMLTASLDWPETDIILSLWSGTPTFNPKHTVIGHIVGLGGDVTLRGHSMPTADTTVAGDGTAQSDVMLIKTVPIGPDITWMTLSERWSTTKSSKLLIYIDEAMFLPFRANGLDVVVTPDWLQQKGWFRG